MPGSPALYEDLWRAVGHDPERLAAEFNALFLEAVRRELATGAYEDDGILGDGGPLWFRPYEYNDLLPLAGLRQVVGHTPPIETLEAEGFFMVDPLAHWGKRDTGRYRYAVIEEGRVRVESGTLRETAWAVGFAGSAW